MASFVAWERPERCPYRPSEIPGPICGWAARLATCEDRALTGRAGSNLRHGRGTVEQHRTYIAMDRSKEKIAAPVFARFLDDDRIRLSTGWSRTTTARRSDRLSDRTRATRNPAPRPTRRSWREDHAPRSHGPGSVVRRPSRTPPPDPRSSGASRRGPGSDGPGIS